MSAVTPPAPAVLSPDPDVARRNGAGGNGRRRSSRTLVLCLFDLAGAWALAYLTRSPELVYAFGLVAAGVSGLWVGGKGVASYHQVLASRAPGNGGAP